MVQWVMCHLGYLNHTGVPNLGSGSTWLANFRIMHILRDSNDGSSTWVPVTHVRDLHGAPGSSSRLNCLQLQAFGKWSSRWDISFSLWMCWRMNASVCVCHVKQKLKLQKLFEIYSHKYFLRILKASHIYDIKLIILFHFLWTFFKSMLILIK